MPAARAGTGRSTRAASIGPRRGLRAGPAGGPPVGGASASGDTGAMPVRIKLPQSGTRLEYSRYWIEQGHPVRAAFWYVRGWLRIPAWIALAVLFALALTLLCRQWTLLPPRPASWVGGGAAILLLWPLVWTGGTLAVVLGVLLGVMIIAARRGWPGVAIQTLGEWARTLGPRFRERERPEEQTGALRVLWKGGAGPGAGLLRPVATRLGAPGPGPAVQPAGGLGAPRFRSPPGNFSDSPASKKTTADSGRSRHPGTRQVRGRGGVRMAGQNQVKILRIGVVHRGRVIEERLFRRATRVSVGSAARNTVVLPLPGVPERVDLLVPRRRADGYDLLLTDEVDGRIDRGSHGMVDVTALRRLTPRRGRRVPRIPLDAACRGRLKIGEVSLLFQFVTPPPRRVRPALPAVARGGLIRSMDWVFATILVGSFLGHSGLFAVANQAERPGRPPCMRSATSSLG